jgi:hypothetical protein
MAYEALVITIDETNKFPHPNADKLELYRFNGAQIAIQKGIYNHGDICLYFMPDTQISDWFLKEHKLYRKNPDNLDEKWNGFFEANGKVKILKLRGEYSEGFLFKLDSSYNLNEGQLVSELDGRHLCNKYLTPAEKKYINIVSNPSKKSRFSILNKIRKFFAPKVIGISQIQEHIDTPQLVHALGKFKEGDKITITEKWHGTSGRTGRFFLTKLVRPWNKEYWTWNLDFKFTSEIQIPVAQSGSRRRIVFDSYLNKMLPEGYYGSEDWRVDIHNSLIEHTPSFHTVYYEIVGYLPNGKPIMPVHTLDGKQYHYDYGCQPGEYKVVVYRITVDFPYDKHYEYTYEELMTYCEARNLLFVPLVDQFIYSGNPKEIVDKVLEYCNANPYSYGGLLEGVVVRNDNTEACNFVKFKSNMFSEAEGIAKQSEKFVDLETMS